MARRLLLLVLFGGFLGLAQTPGPPTFTSVGGLSCGIRMFDAARVQTWCYMGFVPGGASPNLTIVHNTISALPAPAAGQWYGTLFDSYAWVEPDGSLSQCFMIVWAGTRMYQFVTSRCALPAPAEPTDPAGVPVGTSVQTGPCLTTPLGSGFLAAAQ